MATRSPCSRQDGTFSEGFKSPIRGTSIKIGEKKGRGLCEQEYCARGEKENRIKEQQSHLFAGRASTEAIHANQLIGCGSWLWLIRYSMN
ncbi:MAG: hypothetical protein B6D34_00960 [Candidatus Brocadia sp. UTAMX1]|nr:MAG: hypothetical protein B6D34_00960 [Candidatus Brocadia sp. UTAMX1]